MEIINHVVIKTRGCLWISSISYLSTKYPSVVEYLIWMKSRTCTVFFTTGVVLEFKSWRPCGYIKSGRAYFLPLFVTFSEGKSKWNEFGWLGELSCHVWLTFSLEQERPHQHPTHSSTNHDHHACGGDKKNCPLVGFMLPGPSFFHFLTINRSAEFRNMVEKMMVWNMGKHAKVLCKGNLFWATPILLMTSTNNMTKFEDIMMTQSTLERCSTTSFFTILFDEFKNMLYSKDEK